MKAAVKIFVPVFVAILSAAIIIFLFLAAKTRFDRWEASKEEALRLVTETQTIRDQTQRSLSAQNAQPVLRGLSVEGLEEELHKTRRAMDDLIQADAESSASEQQLIFILLHKPFLPLTAEEQKIINDYKSYLDKEYPNRALIVRSVTVAAPGGGKATLEPGLVFEVKSRTNSTVRIQYQNLEREIPISATYVTHEKASPTPTPDVAPEERETKPTNKAAAEITPLPQFVTITQPVSVGSAALRGGTPFAGVTASFFRGIASRRSVLPAGTRLEFVSRVGSDVYIRYKDGEYVIPISATDLK